MDLKSVSRRYEPTNNTEGYDSKIKDAIAERDRAVLEYGLEYHLGRAGLDKLFSKHIILDDNKQAKEYARSSSWEKAAKYIGDTETKIGNIVSWFNNFLDAHGAEEAARATVERLETFLVDAQNQLAKAKACDSFLTECFRKSGRESGYFDYGLSYHIRQVKSAMKKKMDVEKNVQSLQEKVEKLKGFRPYLESKVSADIIQEYGQTLLADMDIVLNEAMSMMGGASEELEAKLEADKAKKEGEGILSKLKNFLRVGKDMLRRHRAEECLKAITDYKEMRPSLDNFLNVDKVGQEYAKLDSDFAELEANIKDQMKDKISQAAIRACKSAYKKAADFENKYRFEEALDALYKAKLELENLKDPDLQDDTKVQECIEEVGQQIIDLQFQITFKMTQRAAKEAIRVNRSHMKGAENHMYHSRFESALESHQKAKEGIEDIRGNSEWANLEEVVEWLTEYETKSTDFTVNYQKTMDDRAVSEALRCARSDFNGAKNDFDHHRHEFALEKLFKFKEKVANISANHSLHPDAASFLSTVDADIEQFERNYAETVTAKAATEEVRVANGAFRLANDRFDHSRFEDSMTEFHKYKELGQALRENELYAQYEFKNVSEFVAALDDNIYNFEKKYTETVTQREANNATRACGSDLTTAQGHFDHYRFESCLESMQKCRDKLDDIRQTDQYMGLNSVISFLDDTSDALYVLENKYEDTMRERSIADAQRKITSSYNSAKNLLEHHRHEDSLRAIQETRDLIDEANRAQVDDSSSLDFIDSTLASLDTLENSVYSALADKEAKENQRVLKSHMNGADSHFDHSRFESALESANKADDQAHNMRMNGADVSEYDGWQRTFKDKYNAEVTTRAFIEAKRKVNSELKSSQDHLDHSRFEACLIALNKANELCCDVLDEFTELKETSDFAEEFSTKAKSIRAKYQDTMGQRSLDESARELKSAMTSADTMLNKHRYDDALEQRNKAKELKEKLALDGQTEAFECKNADTQVQSLVDHYSSWETNFLASYHSVVTERAVKELKRKLGGHRNSAEGHLDHSRFERAMASVQASIDEMGVLVQNQLLCDSEQVKAEVAQHNAWIKSFGGKISQVLLDRSIAEDQRKINHSYNAAEDHFDHNRFEHALMSLQKTHEQLEDYECNGEYAEAKGSGDFVETIRAKIETFERKYSDQVYKSEIERQIRNANSIFARTKSHFEHHRNKLALESFSQARQAACQFGADERFLSNQEVQEFLNSFHERLDKFAQDFEAAQAETELKKAQSEAKSILKNAQNDFDHHRYEAALTCAHKLRDLLADLSAEYYGKSSESQMTRFVDEISASLDSFFETYSDTIFKKEVDGLVRSARGHFNQAKNCFDHHRYEDSLICLNKGKEIAQQLGDLKYDQLSSVDTFFAQWLNDVATFETQYAETVLGRAADENIRQCQSALSSAKSQFEKHIYERALQSLSKASDLSNALSENADFLPLGKVKQFIEAFNAECQVFRVEFNEKVNAREYAEQERKVRSHMSAVTRAFDHHQNDRALEEYTAAKDALSDLKENEGFSTFSALSSLVSDFTGFGTQFEQDYSSRVLAKESNSLIRTAKSRLNQSKTFMDRHVTEKALELLKEARHGSDTQALWEEGSLFRHLPEVTALGQELQAAEEEFAQKILISDARKIMNKTKVTLKPLKKALLRDREAAQSIFQQAKGDAEAVLAQDADGQLFRAIPQVKDFVSELEETAKSVGVSLYEDVSSGKKKKRGKEVSVEDVLGDRFLKDWPKSKLKLTVTRIGPSVHPKFFSALKNVNQQAKNLNRYVKEVFSYLKERDFMDVDENFRVGSSFGPGSSDRLNHERMEKAMKQLLDVDSKDELVEKLSSEWNQFKEGMNAIQAHITSLNTLANQFAQVIWGLNGMRSAVETLEGTSHRLEFGFARDGNILGFNQFDIMKKQDDYDSMGLFAVDVGERLKQYVDSRIEELKSFPRQKYILEEVADLRVRGMKAHALQCVRYVTDKSAQPHYFALARRLPIARRVMKERIALRDAMYRECGRNLHKEPLVVDVQGMDAKADDSFPEESEEWYENPTQPIAPGADDAKLRNLQDQSTSSAWTANRDSLSGKIVFSNEFINEHDDSPSGLKDSFGAGENIYARAYWPRALRNYPIGVDKKSGDPVYGPEVIGDKYKGNNWIELFQFVYIDGEKIERKYQPEGAFSFFRDNGTRQSLDKYKIGSEVDFYAYNQTCRMFIIEQKLADVSDEWNRAAARYAYHFAQLAPGQHEVKVELRYKYYTSFENIQNQCVTPDYCSLMSHPIASGSFTIDIPSGGFSQTPILPLRKSEIKAADADECEKAIFEFMSNSSQWGKRGAKTEEILTTVLQSDYYVTQTAWYEVTISRDDIKLRKEPCEYGRDFLASMYRSPETGWDLEKVAVFSLTAAGANHRNPVAKVPPCTGVYVSRNYTFDAHLLSPEELALIKRRCPENLRDGVKQG